jgi:large subunit ribosomal protein L3
LSQLPGYKVGMTQVYDDARNAIPVTVISCGEWIVTQIKTTEKDGYNALQIGMRKKKYANMPFAQPMLSKKSQFFSEVREVTVEATEGFTVGQTLSLKDVSFNESSKVAVTGKSTGRGFQGVVKRWNFAGGPRSHGSMLGRLPGSIGNMCSQGKVIKGKKLPGRMGGKQITVQGLQVVKVDTEQGVVLVKGAVPGRKNSPVYVSKQG